MSWRDDNIKTEKKDLPISQYFPTYEKGGNVIPANADMESSAEDAAAYDQMNFDEGRSQAGQMIGSITASLKSGKPATQLASAIVPKQLKVATTAVKTGLQVASAWAGGGLGDILQSSAQGDLKKHTWATALDSAFDAGNEEAMYELLGLGAGGVILKGAKFAAGKPYLNIQFIKDKIAASGGSLTASQIVDGTILDTIEGLAEVSWGGDHVRRMRTLNDEGVNKYVDEFQKDFIAQTDLLDSSWEVGRVYKQAVEVGQQHHREMGGQMFEHLDEVVGRTKVTAYEGPGQSMVLNSSSRATVDMNRGMVSTKGLKAWAKQQINQIKGVEGALDSWQYDYLTNILDEKNLATNINFKAAQALRSEWLEKLRNFENKTLNTYNTKDAGAVNKMTQFIDDAMQTTATKLGDDFLGEFRTANKFWKAGANRL